MIIYLDLHGLKTIYDAWDEHSKDDASKIDIQKKRSCHFQQKKHMLKDIQAHYRGLSIRILNVMFQISGNTTIVSTSFCFGQPAS